MLSAKKYRNYQYAVPITQCQVWWGKASAGNVLVLGEDTKHHKLALCRTFGGEQGTKALGFATDFGSPSLGTFVLEGPDKGKCFFERINGATGVVELNSGNFHVLMALRQDSSGGDESRGDSGTCSSSSESDGDLECPSERSSGDTQVVAETQLKEKPQKTNTLPQLPPREQHNPAALNWQVRDNAVTYTMTPAMQKRVVANGRILFSKIQLKSSCGGKNTNNNKNNENSACGRVEVQTTDTPGLWRPLCSHNWTMREADVICTTLGFVHGAAAAFPHFGFGFGGGEEEVGPAVANLTCRTGLEKHMHDCDYMFAHQSLSCDVRTESVGVACRLSNREDENKKNFWAIENSSSYKWHTDEFVYLDQHNKKGVLREELFCPCDGGMAVVDAVTVTENYDAENP